MPREPRQYQHEGIRRCVEIIKEHGGAILADDPGLGKTLQSVRVASACTNSPKLIVAPAMARETWVAELGREEVPAESIGLALPLGLKRADLAWTALAAGEQPWVITSYDLLPKLMEVRFKKRLPGFLIVDEAHMIKGRDTKGRMTKRAQLVYDVAQLVPRKLLLTGTPMADHPRDLYNLLITITGGRRFWGGPWQFDKKYCGGHQGDHGWVNTGTGPEDISGELKRFMVRREKREVAEQLPSLTRQIVWLDPDQYGSAALAAAMTSRTVHSTQAALEATLEAKMPAAMDMAEQAGRFLLLTWLKAHCHKMHNELNERGVRCFYITGEMPPTQREQVAQRAAEEKVGVVATLDSVWQSIDALKAVASYGIMHALSYRWHMMVQAESRLHRMGQKDPVHWVYLACRDTMDELVVRAIVEKMDQYRETVGSAGEATSLREDLAVESQSLGDIYGQL
jgi:SWI/SNF-related matrix-associated actin-dependent regulator 1 of chromatin subfamily A